MIIQSIELNNFRNYTREKFEFDEGTNVLYGDNAQGKTNVLEAIFVGATTRSHKGSKDIDMIKKGEEEAHIRYFVKKKERLSKVEIHLRRGKSKGIAIDGMPIKSSKDLMGLSNVIFFSPEDLSIIKDGPDQRRRFMDLELCQLDKTYLYYLTQYKKVLKQRNALLKQIREKEASEDVLEIWDSQLVEYGKKLIEKRKNFVEEIGKIMSKKHRDLTGGKENVEVYYKPSCLTSDMEEKLFVETSRDIYMGTTTVGPHRDDISFYIDAQEIKTYGSQGQKRTAALSLKMAEIEIVESITGERPILLLDDVLSELDRNRQNYLLESIRGIQTIITCTGLEEIIKNGININQTFEIIDGKIKKTDNMEVYS